MAVEQNQEISAARPFLFQSKRWIAIKLNILLSFFGNAWSAALGILFVPLYLRYIGVEAYGVIGFFAGVQAVLGLLDLGLSPSFNREIARLTAVASSEQITKVRVLVKTLSTLNWLITGLLALILFGISPLLAHWWVNSINLSPDEITQCFLLISISFVAYFPTGFYNAGLAGLQLQTASSLVVIVCGTLRSVGALLVLAYVSPTIQAFLIWQAVIAIVQLAATTLAFKGSLPRSNIRPAADFSLVRQISRFAAGNFAISITALILSQLDRFVLGKIVSLEDFGYYVLATMIASTGLVMLVAAVTKVAYPQFSRMVAVGDDRELRRVYHQNAQLVSALIIPATVVLAVYAHEILYAWTGNGVVADKSSPVLALYSIGMGLNCLLWLPNSMQLAHGWTRLTLFKNIAAIVLFAPFLYWSVVSYGIVGGAIGWASLNVVFMIVYVWLMHRKILNGEALKWYLYDIGLPALVSVPVALLGKSVVSVGMSRFTILVVLASIGLAVLTAAAFSMAFVREQILRRLFAWQNLVFRRT